MRQLFAWEVVLATDVLATEKQWELGAGYAGKQSKITSQGNRIISEYGKIWPVLWVPDNCQLPSTSLVLAI